MTRSLWLTNLLLCVVVAFLLGAIVHSFVNGRPSFLPAQPSSSAQRPPAPTVGSVDAPDPTQRPRPPLSEFAILVQREVFKTPVVEPPAVPVVRKPPPPPPPLPTLIGTVFVGDERKAMLKEGKRADLYLVGDEVAGGKLVKIDADRIVIQRGETSVEVILKPSFQPVASQPTPSPPNPGGQGAALPTLPGVGTTPAGAPPVPVAGPTPTVIPDASVQPQLEGLPRQYRQETAEDRLRRLRDAFLNRKLKSTRP